jgi:hypothetical protein
VLLFFLLLDDRGVEMVMNGFRLVIEPPSGLSWLLGGVVLLAGVVLPALYIVLLRKQKLFAISHVDMTKLV